MRRGNHRYERGRPRWPFVLGIVVALAVAGTAVWLLLFHEDSPLAGEDRAVPEFSFAFGKVGGSAVGERASPETIEQAAAGVRRTLDSMFVAGFIDPAKWRNGRYPQVLRGFTEDARKRAAEEIDSFSLGPEPGRVEFVQPRTGRLSVRFLIDGEGAPTGAVARTTFFARGDLRDGGKVDVRHRAVWYMQPEGRRWLVTGYDVEGGIGPPTPDAGPGGTP